MFNPSYIQKQRNKEELIQEIISLSNKKQRYKSTNFKNLDTQTLTKMHNALKIGSSKFINIPNHGRRKIRYQKNGRAYVIVNKKKLKL